MLPRFRRLSHRTFADAFARGKKYRTKYFTIVFIAAGDTQSSSQVAVVVGKKVYKSAVARNWLRRRLYDALDQAGVLPNTSPYPVGVYIIIAQPTAALLSRKSITPTLMEALQQMKVAS